MKNKIIVIIVTFVLVFLVIIVFHLINVYLRASRCGIENCHGFDIKCGPNIPEACTMEYQIGDGCRQYARCEIVRGKCQLVEVSAFKKCKSCVQECIGRFSQDILKQFECEKKCYY